ncbi:hypothetical protein [Patiriisocius marinistellae]|nr:hypothetical protein [Patiriisocius marinistellae]
MKEGKFDFNLDIIPSPQIVKKFYLLDYFLILLQSCSLSNEYHKIFSKFKLLKEKERLGESKYRKLVIDESEELSETQVKRYMYTFDQVIIESENCGLIKKKSNQIQLTKRGQKCLILADNSKRIFYNELLAILEAKYHSFYQLLNLCYNQNKQKGGLLIFPIYSPRKLGFDKKEMHTTYHILQYSYKLRLRLEKDIESNFGKKKSLKNFEDELLLKLFEDKIISNIKDKKFNKAKYNSIISRFRKYWLNIFLKEIYKYPYSFETFNIWVERGKQLGVIHTTEFYPNFDGRLVYPTSVILKKNSSLDLVNSYNYSDGQSLFIHKPKWNNGNNPNRFFEALTNAYFDLKNNRKTTFIRIADLREKVCYKMRIPTFIFNEFLELAYNENLKGETKIKISLEADRLPHETNAMYLKREPVIINNQQKNIVAIDYKKP